MIDKVSGIYQRTLPPLWASSVYRLVKNWTAEILLIVYILFFFVWPLVMSDYPDAYSIMMMP